MLGHRMEIVVIGKRDDRAALTRSSARNDRILWMQQIGHIANVERLFGNAYVRWIGHLMQNYIACQRMDAIGEMMTIGRYCVAVGILKYGVIVWSVRRCGRHQRTVDAAVEYVLLVNSLYRCTARYRRLMLKYVLMRAMQIIVLRLDGTQWCWFDVVWKRNKKEWKYEICLECRLLFFWLEFHKTVYINGDGITRPTTFIHCHALQLIY